MNAGYGIKPKFGGAFNLNIRKNKINFFADFTGSYNMTQENTDILRTHPGNSQLSSIEISSFRPPILQLSASWQLGDTKIKKASARQTGSEEERQRMN